MSKDIVKATKQHLHAYRLSTLKCIVCGQVKPGVKPAPGPIH